MPTIGCNCQRSMRLRRSLTDSLQLRSTIHAQKSDLARGSQRGGNCTGDVRDTDQSISRSRSTTEGARMATEKDFTADEWKGIAAAPLMAGLVVTMADVSGPIGVAKEAIAVSKAIGESASASSGELIRTLAEAFKKGARPEMPSVPKDREQARTAFVTACKNAVAT